MFLQLVKPLSLLLSLSLLLAFVFHFFGRHRLAGKFLSGIIYGIIAIIAMMMPFDFLPGFIFDSRSVIVSLSGFFGGAAAAVPAAIIAASFRLYLGGAGAAAGALVVIIAAISGAAYYYIRNRYKIETKAWHFFLFGLISHFLAIFGLAILPSETMWVVIRKLSIPFFTIYPVTTVFLGTIIYNIELHFERKKELKKTKNEYEKLNRILQNKINELKMTEESLRKSNDRFRDIAQSMADWIWETDKNGKYTYASNTAKKILGYSAEELIGKTPFELMPEKEAVKLKESFRQIVSRREPIVDLENWNIAKDGTTVCLLTNGVPIIDSDGELHGYRGVDKDITARKEIEKEKAILESHLRQSQKMESIGNLAGGIAHDFNNILSSIIGFTELALDEAKAGTNIEDNLQEIYSAGKRARDLVAQILTFARQSDEPMEPIQIVSIVEEVLEFIRSSIPATIEIEKNIQSDAFIMGNPIQIHQIIMNLCTNASHAMEASGGTLKVDIKDVMIDKATALRKLKMRPGDYVAIKVSDTGAGIPPDVIESIFEPYFTTKNLGDGTGMGLAVAQGIVDKCNGKISVDSRIGEGTTICVYLPVTKNGQIEHQYMTADLPIGDERVLFIDDEASIAKMGARILGKLGYAVTTRINSVEALALFKANPDEFDIVISDMTMPNMTGDVLAVELMAIRPDIPIVLCTGYSKNLPDENATQVGIRAIAYKPLAEAELAKTVRKVLDEAKATRNTHFLSETQGINFH